MRVARDLTGTKRGFLEVVGKAHTLNHLNKAGGLKYQQQFWRCECTCGAEKCKRFIVTPLHGATSSCGAKRCKPAGEADLRRTMRNYVDACTKYRRRHPGSTRNFHLTFEQFREIIVRNCHWCGDPPEARDPTKRRYNGHVPHHGLDRVDNDGSYTLDNCVSACRICNIMKQSMSPEAFIAHVRKLVLHQRNRY